MSNTKQKSWYKTNCNKNKVEEVLFLNEDEVAEIFNSEEILKKGYFCEEISKKDLEVETETKELGSCSFCSGTIVADAVKISYKKKVIKYLNPSWGACWDCGAI